MYTMGNIYNWNKIAHIRQRTSLFQKCLSSLSTIYNNDRPRPTTKSMHSRMNHQHCPSVRVIETPRLFSKNMLLYQPFVLRLELHTSHNTECAKKPPENSHSHTSHSPRHCWNCGRDTSPVRELFFCDCGVVQKPACELTYFDLMQLKPSFDVDIKKLSVIFKETQKRLHPDKFSANTQEERDLAQQQSALLNKAYNTIQKPLSRAIYLLELQNIEISEKDNFTEPDFLMAIMDVNEQISTAKKPSDVEALETINEAKIAKCVKEISDLYNRNLINDMKRATIQLRYYTTIQERINELKRSNMG